MLPALVEHIHLVVDCIVSDCSSSNSSSSSSIKVVIVLVVNSNGSNSCDDGNLALQLPLYV
jgi:hypothetical protein